MDKITRIPLDVARERAERAARFLAADPRVKLVFFFGSAADPDRKIPVRDVDLAILTDPPLGLWELLRLGERTAFAVEGDIDLVSLNEAGVVLAREVANTGRCLYTDPPELETDFVCRARMRYLDFKYYLDEQWKISGERLEERLRHLEVKRS
ncbi:MAG TPA: nucleotidyltransferase domain-containing protein [Thermoanaerobaculia bacterium]|nr:nucleotidyltransferase domain-containing protein [Thermoanaerobaculia bacterium]